MEGRVSNLKNNKMLKESGETKGNESLLISSVHDVYLYVILHYGGLDG